MNFTAIDLDSTCIVVRLQLTGVIDIVWPVGCKS